MAGGDVLYTDIPSCVDELCVIIICGCGDIEGVRGDTEDERSFWITMKLPMHQIEKN